MELADYTIKRKHKNETECFTLVPIGDIHLGAAGCAVQRLNETIDFIASEPSVYWVGMGDYIDAINPSDKRFDPTSIDPSYNIKNLSQLITTQINDLKSMFRPIKDKCIGLLAGNHEDHIRKQFKWDVTVPAEDDQVLLEF